MEKQKGGYPVNWFRVCVDSCGPVIAGRVISPMCKEEIGFVGLGEMVLRMDKLFDNMGYPQAFQDKRSFEKVQCGGNVYRGIPEPVFSTEVLRQSSGMVCTYDISVESRRNTSWQGVLWDINGERLADFNGEVQLLDHLEKRIREE